MSWRLRLLRFYWREIKNMRQFRLTRARPAHMTPLQWRLLEYRFTWALAKQITRAHLHARQAA